MRTACSLLAILCLGAATTAAAETPDEPAGAPYAVDDPFSSPYVYQNAGRGRGMSATVQYEAGYGSRESRSLAPEGIEQGLRLRIQPWEFLGFEAFAGLVFGSSDRRVRGVAGSVEVIGRALDQQRHAINLDLGAGYLRDYRGAHVPRVRLVVGRSFGRLDASLSGLVEIPVGSAGRDEVDVMTSVAVSYGIRPWVRLGLEVAGEDLEGLADPDEAEGGAKVLFGPTVAFTLPQRFFVKLNASPVVVVGPRPSAWGFMGRAVVGWCWE